VNRWDELPPRDPDEEEWNAEDYGRYRRWFDVYGATSIPLQPYHTGDTLPHVPSTTEIPNVGYIPQVPHTHHTIH
jgi:hypothetical protein